MVPVGSNSSTGAKPTVVVAVAVAVAVAADTGISGFGRLQFYCFQQAKRERALGALNGTPLHVSLSASQRIVRLFSFPKKKEKVTSESCFS